jgi:hypothetical protein
LSLTFNGIVSFKSLAFSLVTRIQTFFSVHGNFAANRVVSKNVVFWDIFTAVTMKDVVFWDMAQLRTDISGEHIDYIFRETRL